MLKVTQNCPAKFMKTKKKMAGQFWVTFKKIFGTSFHEKIYFSMNFPIPVFNLPPEPRNIERSDKKYKNPGKSA